MTQYDCYECEEYVHMEELSESWEYTHDMMTRIQILRCPECGTKYRRETYYEELEGEDMERIEE